MQCELEDQVNLQEVLEGTMGIKFKPSLHPIELYVPEEPCDLDMDSGCLKPAVAAAYLKRHARSLDHMRIGFLEDGTIRPHKCLASVLPLCNERSLCPVTTSQAVIVFLNARHSMTYCLMTEHQVVEIALRIKKSVQDSPGTVTSHAVDGFCKVSRSVPCSHAPM